MLGFGETPVELDKVLRDQRFMARTTALSGPGCSAKVCTFRHFDEEVSTRGVRVLYYDRANSDRRNECGGVVRNPARIAATCIVTTLMDRSDYDLQKQWLTARTLRHHYDAVLYDPQTGQVVPD